MSRIEGVSVKFRYSKTETLHRFFPFSLCKHERGVSMEYTLQMFLFFC